MTDKVLHFMAGAFVSIVVGYLTKMPILGLVAAAIVGLLKEFWDIEHGTAEFLDFVATVLGGALFFAIFTIAGI
jgi:uncharacterized membrane protein YeaQ/YmgE (transglycosylase-associated protein family)